MSLILGLLVGWKAKLIALLAGGAVTGTLASIVTGAVRVVVGLLEIVIDLAKSPEGRILLLILILTGAGCYGRYHYLSQGRSEICAAVTVKDGPGVRKACGLPVKTVRQ